MYLITDFIASTFVAPVSFICFRLTVPTCARMAVPETTMHKDDFFAARKDDVRLSGQVSAVQSIAKAKSIQKVADN